MKKTRRNTPWKPYKPQPLKGDPLTPPLAVASRYNSNLNRLILKMTHEVKQALKELYDKPKTEQYFAQDASMSEQAKVLTDSLVRKYNKIFADHSQEMAETFIEQVDRSSINGVNGSIKGMAEGLALPLTDTERDIFKASVTENVALIKSIPQQYLSGVQQAVMRSITTKDSQPLVKYLQKHEGITLRRARTIALDQTRKAYSALNTERMKKLGLKKFIWRHSGGSDHPRKLHQSYDGKIFSFDDPPIIDEKTGERGMPGQAINCRCKAQPVIAFDD